MSKDSFLSSLAYINMWKDKLWYTVPTVVAVAVSQYSCAPTTTISSENLPPPTKTTDEADIIRKQTEESFLNAHPEYEGRKPTVINFRVGTVKADTIAFVSTEKEKAEISEVNLKIEGVKVTPYTDAIVWTLQTNPDFSENWVELTGAQYKRESTDEIITVWYTPTGVDKDGNIDHRKVIAFNSGAPEYVFYPLVVPSENILWSKTLITQEESKFEPWDGIQPFTLSTGSIPEGPGKNGLMSLVAVEAVSEEFNNVQEEIAKSKIYTLTPNGIEVEIEDGTIVPVEGIKPNIKNGTFTITLDNETYIVEFDQIEGQILTFKDSEGKIFIVDGERLIDIPPLPEEIVKLQKNLDGTNYAFAWNNDLKSIALTYTNPETQNTSTIPEIVFDEKGNWKRTHTFETPYGSEAEVTIDNRVDKMTVTETPEGKKVLDFSAWRLVDGKWEREVEQGEPQLNVSEAQQILIENGSEHPDDTSDKSRGVQLILEYTNALFPGQVGRYEGTIKYNEYSGIIKAKTSNSRWGASEITTLDEHGQKVVIKTTSYVILNFTNGKSAMIYKDKDRKFKIIFIDADLNNWSNWSPYF